MGAAPPLLEQLSIFAEVAYAEWQEALDNRDRYRMMFEVDGDDHWEGASLQWAAVADRREDEYWGLERDRHFAEEDLHERWYDLHCRAHRGRDHKAVVPRRGPRARGAGRPARRRSSRTSRAGPGDEPPGEPDEQLGGPAVQATTAANGGGL